MNNIIKIIILIFAMSFLSGQVLAQSKKPAWAATPRLDSQIVAAKKALVDSNRVFGQNRAKYQSLLKAKKAVLAKRKKIMATPKLNKQIVAAQRAKDKAKVQELVKRKKAVIAKRIAEMKSK